MGKLFRNIALFSLPIWVLLVWMVVDTPPASYRYLMVQKDCRNGSWIQRRLFKSNDPVDIAFVGTSKTMCDVNDALLEEKLNHSTGKSFRVANLGICRLGENLHYLIARDLFTQKKPKYLIYEVSTELEHTSHFNFPHVATLEDALGASPALIDVYVGDLISLSWNRLVYHREHFLGIERHFEDFLDDSLHSFMLVNDDMIADSVMMATTKARRTTKLNGEFPTGINRLLYDWRSKHPKSYLQAVQALCAAQGTQLVFLYLPSYGAAAKQPTEYAFLEEMGEIWTPPDSVFGNYKLHMDENHLNMAGAAKLSNWLSAQLEELVSD